MMNHRKPISCHEDLCYPIYKQRFSGHHFGECQAEGVVERFGKYELLEALLLVVWQSLSCAFSKRRWI